MEKLQFTKAENEVAFHNEIKQEVYSLLGHDRSLIGPDLWFWSKATFWFVVCWGSYFLVVSQSVVGASAFFLTMLFQIAGLLFGFSIGHEASHRIISRTNWINHVFHFFSFLTVGVDPRLWGLRHIKSHHIYPNVEGSDIDIDKNPLLRLSPCHPWKPMYKYQHIYAPLAYSLALIHSVCWGDWVYLLSKEYEWIRDGESKRKLWATFLLFKALHFFMLLVLPSIFLPYSFIQIFLFYLLFGAISSLIFIVMLVGTHFFLEASYPSPDDGKLSTSWAIHNLSTSCDWNPNSAVARFLSGGANCHAAHHLFPNICHVHYGKINPVIEKVTKKYGVPYHSKSLWEMMVSHFAHLKKMGERPADELNIAPRRRWLGGF